MKVILISYGVFKLATDEEIELPIFWGKISIQRYEIETWFTYGEFSCRNGISLISRNIFIA
jgi:hypothetical protein